MGLHLLCFPPRLGLVISSLEFMRRLVMGLNLGKEPPLGLPKSRVTLGPGWTPD